MEFGYLADHRHFIPQLAGWQHAEWAWIRPGDTVEARMGRIEAECGRCEVPTVLIAFANGELLGSAGLVEHDMDSRRDLSPWLAGVFVSPGRRGCGIGSGLVKRVMDEAKSIGIRRLFLYTPGAERFYARLGWSVFERTDYRGAGVTIMSFDLIMG